MAVVTFGDALTSDLQLDSTSFATLMTTTPKKPPPSDKQCTGGMVWKECGSACTPSCENSSPICTMQCVARCECPPSTPILKDGVCVTSSACDAPKSSVAAVPSMDCVPRRNVPCPRIFRPVCAGGVTYSNDCLAKADCQVDFTDGPCTLSPTPSATTSPASTTASTTSSKSAGSTSSEPASTTASEPASSTDNLAAAPSAAPTCTGGKHWAECGSACTRTCDDPSPLCTRQCVRRCACPANAPIDKDGVCITLDACAEPSPSVPSSLPFLIGGALAADEPTRGGHFTGSDADAFAANGQTPPTKGASIKRELPTFTVEESQRGQSLLSTLLVAACVLVAGVAAMLLLNAYVFRVAKDSGSEKTPMREADAQRVLHQRGDSFSKREHVAESALNAA